MAPLPAGLPPGAHVLRRRDDRWQIGLDPRRRVLLREPPAAASPGGGSVLPPAAGSLPPTVLHTLAALAREAGADCAAVLARRRDHVVQVETFGHSLSASLGLELLDLCVRTGLRVPGPPRPGPRRRSEGSPTNLVTVVGVGEPSRHQLDGHVRAQLPHLLVRLTEGRAVVGPFVVPGRTPCLRCTDAHLTDADPSWPLLVEQYARAVRTERADGVPEPVDAALASLALAWAARDLATYAEGGTPTTLASTVELSARLETVETRQWSPHPRCGCSWR